MAGVLFFALLIFLARKLDARVDVELLKTRFGTGYEDYCNRVPRWVPAIGRLGRG